MIFFLPWDSSEQTNSKDSAVSIGIFGLFLEAFQPPKNRGDILNGLYNGYVCTVSESYC